MWHKDEVWLIVGFNKFSCNFLLLAMANDLLAMANDLLAMANDLLAMANDLLAVAKNLLESYSMRKITGKYFK